MNTPMGFPWRRPRRAFTLIELLTVIAIIGVLAAILVPTVSKVRATAKKSQCVSNLRQWGTAVRLFANENKGVVALYNKDVGDWALYAPYFGQKYMVSSSGSRELSQVVLSRCSTADPSSVQERDYAFVRPTDAPKAKKGSDFGISDTNNIYVYNLSDARSPSRLFLMVEVETGHNDHYVLSAATEFSSAVLPMQVNAANSARVRHGGIANMLYLDGHVSSLSATQTNSSIPATRMVLAQSMLLNN